MRRQRKMQKHPNGQYTVRIMQNGVSKNFFLGRNEKQARKKLAQIEQDLASGRFQFVAQQTTATLDDGGKRDMRIEELIVEHLKWVRANRAESTFKLRKHCALKFLDFIGPVMVSDITRMKLEEFYTKMKLAGGKPNSGNEDFVKVKTMLRWGEEIELIDLAFKRFPKIRYVPPPSRRVDAADLEALLSRVPMNFRDMILFGVLTGLRPIELRELTQDQIRHTDEGRPYVYIEGHKTARTVGEPRPRTVPLCSMAEEIVEHQIKQHPEQDHIFLNDAGTPYEKSVYKNKLVRWCRRAGIKDFTPYALRHTFASMESDAGVETTSLARLMGHAQTRTLQRYVTNTYESHLKAVEKLGARLKKVIRG